MRKSNTEKIDSLIWQYLRAEGIETPYNQFRIVQAWPEVMGKGIEKYTGNIYVKNQTLHVQIKSPVLKNDLMLEHRNLARRLNEHIGAQVIEDVHFY